MKAHLALLKKLDACADARTFAETQPNLETAWATCKRSDWMIWLLKKLDFQDDRAYRLYACRCVRDTLLADGRKVWDLLTDPRSRNAVEVAERFANGQTSQEEMAAAWAAAWAAARDAAWGGAWGAAGAAARAAARDAAWGGAWDAARAAAGAAARDAAGGAAWGAAWDAARAAAWGAAGAAARAAARAAQADYLRELVPWATVAALIEKWEAK